MKKAIAATATILISVLVAVGALLAFVTIAEYTPEDVESNATIGGAQGDALDRNSEYSITSFNIGYGGLGETEDFFMDGGSNVRPDSKAMVEDNIANIKNKIVELDSDFVLLQEVDEDSKRSYNLNQVDELLLDGMEGSFAYNYKAAYVPFPLPTIGKVSSGILTMGKFEMLSSERISLPNPFSWPVRTVNLKRAIEVTRYPVADTENEFVLINLHLEAFDSGEGKLEQTRMLSEIISTEYDKGNYVIAGGDWNQTLVKDLQVDPARETDWVPGTLDWDSLPDWEMGVDENAPSGRSLIKPYVGNEDTLAKYFIDGFIVSPNIEIIETRVSVMDHKYSDHEPVKMTFTIRE
jgi:endonuclease/exonuclease/phosphatase family metal-dependent hydrolase